MATTTGWTTVLYVLVGLFLITTSIEGTIAVTM